MIKRSFSPFPSFAPLFQVSSFLLQLLDSYIPLANLLLLLCSPPFIASALLLTRFSLCLASPFAPRHFSTTEERCIAHHGSKQLKVWVFLPRDSRQVTTLAVLSSLSPSIAVLADLLFVISRCPEPPELSHIIFSTF